ncbi:MAG: hypothetical protein WA418_24610, partial [Bradyrhizobium sp.]
MDRVFFLHVPKTGGSSLTSALSKKFASWEIFPWRHSRLDLFNHADLMRFRFFSGHFNITDLDYIPKPVKAVTLIREPRKRILSLYHFWRSYRKDTLPRYEPHHSWITQSVGLRGFLMLPNPSLRVTIDNALVQAYLPYPIRGRNHALAAAPETIVEDALRALDRMAAFGILERFDDSMQAIGGELQSPLILPAEKVRSFESLATSSFHEALEREAVTPEIEGLLDTYTELDRVFYDRAREVFETRFKRHFQGVANGQNAGPDGPLVRRAVAHEWGDWINFGGEFHLDGVEMVGWSSQEEWGVWSSTDRPSLKIGPLPRPTGVVRLTIAVRGAVFNTHPEQTVTVALDGHPIES